MVDNPTHSEWTLDKWTENMLDNPTLYVLMLGGMGERRTREGMKM
jgi:hypothetical protein